MSDANRTKVGRVREATPGITPATPAFKNLRIKSSALSFVPKTVESKELRADRMIADIPRVMNDVGGTLPMEVSWGSLDDIMEMGLQNTWQRLPVRANNGVASSQITSVAVSGVYNFLTTAGTPSDVNAGAYVIGQLVRATGFANPANNGRMRVTTGGAVSFTASAQASAVDAAPAGAARLKVIGFQGVAADITATATGLASTTLDFTTLGLKQGQWLRIGNAQAPGESFATAANTGWARVNGVITATALPLDNLPVGWAVDTGAGKTITVYYGDMLQNGTVEMTDSIEQQYQDLAVPEYDVFTGMAVDQLALSLKSNQLVDAVVTYIGFNASNGTARIVGATDIAAPTNDVVNTSSNVGVIAENGVALTGTTAVLSLDLAFTNSIRRRVALGTLGSVDIASGSFRCKGKASIYYASNAIRTKVLNGTASALYARTVDATAPNGSRAYVIDLPRIKYEDGNPTVPGIDSDRTIDPQFAALAHPTLGYAASIQRVEEYF